MKYLDDFYPGQVFEYRSDPLSVAQIKAFAAEWDPQALHLDEEAASKIHGSLIASGFQTVMIVFKPVMHELMTDVANIGGMGFDNLRWLRPLLPNQALDIRMVIDSVTPSRSKPDRGVLKYTIEARNPTAELVFTTEVPVMIKRREDDAK